MSKRKKRVTTIIAITVLLLLLFIIISSLSNSSTPLDSAEVGDTVVYGSYEQDGKDSNGNEPIEWEVIAKEDDKILVISKYALDNTEYNEGRGAWSNVYDPVTWETCSLRAWLNNEFLYEAFSDEEQQNIVDSALTTPEGWNGVEAGNDTIDKVFVLSVEEAERYMNDEERMCQPTKYLESKGVYVEEDPSRGKGNVWWFLRTSGIGGERALIVIGDGVVHAISYNLPTHYDITVRPALWIYI